MEVGHGSRHAGTLEPRLLPNKADLSQGQAIGMARACRWHAARMPFLVIGGLGSGKSILTRELHRRGYRAVDADVVPGLAAWLNAEGTVVGDGSLKPTPELLATCFWGWSGDRLGEVLEDLGGDGILLGIAVNQWEFLGQFSRLVLLELDPVSQQQRVASRHELLREQIQSGLPVLQSQMLERGAARVSATRSTAEVADEVIELLMPRGDI